MSGDTELLVLRMALLAVIFAFVLAASLSMLSGFRPARPADRKQPRATGPSLVIEGVARTGMQPGAAFPLAGRMTVGRDAASGILLPDPSVSGHHATIEQVAGGWRVYDAGSTNGTLVEGRPIDRRGTTLRGGELITFGAVALRFHL